MDKSTEETHPKEKQTLYSKATVSIKLLDTLIIGAGLILLAIVVWMVTQ